MTMNPREFHRVHPFRLFISSISLVVMFCYYRLKVFRYTFNNFSLSRTVRKRLSENRVLLDEIKDLEFRLKHKISLTGGKGDPSKALVYFSHYYAPLFISERIKKHEKSYEAWLSHDAFKELILPPDMAKHLEGMSEEDLNEFLSAAQCLHGIGDPSADGTYVAVFEPLQSFAYMLPLLRSGKISFDHFRKTIVAHKKMQEMMA